MGTNRSKNRSPFIMLALAAVIVVLLGWSYNRVISKEEAVLSAWAQLESNYQRRHDLIPSLVATVSRYLEHEQETLQGIVEGRQNGGNDLAAALDAMVEAREKAANVTADSAGQMLEDERTLQRIAHVQARLSRESARLMAVVENYPQLRSGDQFLALQAQIEGTENRINVARIRYNDAAEAFNASIRRVPGNLWASVENLERKTYFEADGEAGNAAVPDFD